MSTVLELKRKYADAVRNIPIEDVIALEKGEPCTSSVMQYAQTCYRELVSKRATPQSSSTLPKPAVCKWVESFGI